MITIADCITELNRERNMRSHVYPKLMHRGKLTLREIDRRNGRLGKAIEFFDRDWETVCNCDHGMKFFCDFGN